MARMEADQGSSQEMLGFRFSKPWKFQWPIPAASSAQQDKLMTLICMAG